MSQRCQTNTASNSEKSADYGMNTGMGGRDRLCDVDCEKAKGKKEVQNAILTKLVLVHATRFFISTNIRFMKKIK